MNLLIVEDERTLAKEIASYLDKENFLCDLAFTGNEASDLIKEARKNGIDVSFIIITARGAVEDKVRGLDLGADDYLSKPFALTELHSRIMAVARRKFHISSPDITLGEFILAIQARKIFHNGREIEITKKEFDLLHYLVMNHNKVLARHQLYEHLWGNTLDDQYDSNFIDVHIKNLRKKLNICAPTPWLETVRGVGYRISVDQ
jgi:DNA-binding response OmpR family regulator